MADTEKINAEALALHKKFHGKLEVRCKAPLENGHDLALAYTPGVAEPCRKIKENPDLSLSTPAGAIWSPSSVMAPVSWGWGTSVGGGHACHGRQVGPL